MRRYTEFRVDANSIREYPDGSIRVTGQLTHPGILTYRNDGGTRREYRPADETFRPDAMASFAAMPVTIGHPGGGKRKVSADTWKTDAIGHVGENVRQEGDHVVADLYIKDARAVQMVKDRSLSGISCGYDVMRYDATPGVTEKGERYDGVQRGVVGNHVALLTRNEAPRGGPSCMLRLDANEDELNFEEQMSEALQAQVTVLTGELEKARADAADLPTVRAELATTKMALDAANAQLAPERLDALVEERTTVVTMGKAAGVETAGKSSLQIKRAIVAKKTPALAARADSMSVETVDACLAAYESQPHPSLATLAAAGSAAPTAAGTRIDATDAPKFDIGAMAEKSRQAAVNAWHNTGEKVPAFKGN